MPGADAATTATSSGPAISIFAEELAPCVGIPVDIPENSGYFSVVTANGDLVQLPWGTYGDEYEVRDYASPQYINYRLVKPFVICYIYLLTA